MKLISRLRDERYCAYCRSPRRVYLKKHVDLTNVLGVLIVCLGATYGIWGGPDPRGMVVFCTAIGIGEVFVYMRWRAAVVCRLCGFDPVVYKRSPEKAAALVNQFFREQADNPRFWLSKSPLLTLHRRLREEQRRREELAMIKQMVGARTSRAAAAAAEARAVASAAKAVPAGPKSAPSIGSRSTGPTVPPRPVPTSAR